MATKIIHENVKSHTSPSKLRHAQSTSCPSMASEEEEDEECAQHAHHRRKHRHSQVGEHTSQSGDSETHKKKKKKKKRKRKRVKKMRRVKTYVVARAPLLSRLGCLVLVFNDRCGWYHTGDGIARRSKACSGRLTTRKSPLLH